MSNEHESQTTGFEVAIIGMTGRFPGARNIDEYWENLKNGVETMSFFIDEELEDEGVDPDSLEDPDYKKAKGTFGDIEYFEPTFFGYSAAEAEKMGPQIRILHECTWEALEDAGYNLATYNKLIGFYVGATNNFNWQWLIKSSGTSSSSEAFATIQLCDKDHISTRISYKLDLIGPSFTIETQCSTSLVAVHLAIQGLLSGECDLALAGGVSITIPKKSGYIYQEGMVESKDGHVRAFDARATGTVFGNGAGLVALKRLNEAIEDMDHIYAVIKGSAINNDGNRKVGYMAPSVEGQVEVIRAALQMAEVEPETISYFETHGTGTILGDPIEIEALTQAFNTSKRGFCKIGSVKSNVGHLADAAGVASLIKTVLALKHKLIPPSLHYENPNPKIEFENTPFCINSKPSEWKNENYPLRAGVSSFGIGGTNSNVILEEAPPITHLSTPHRGSSTGREHQLILLSAKTINALDQSTQNLVEYLEKNNSINLADVAYTLIQGRQAFGLRRMMVGSTMDEVMDALENHDRGKMQTSSAGAEEKLVVFMFSGQGPQYVNMAWDIYRTEPSFQQDVDHCLDILKSIYGHDLTPILYPGMASANNQEETRDNDDKNKIDEMIYSGPIKFTIDYSLARLLMKWGIQPAAMIGHSFGEYVAACLSGVFSLEDAMKLVVVRGQLIDKTARGAMLSVPLSQEELKPMLNDELSLAAVNTPSLCIVSGSRTAVDALEKEINQKGYECIHLNLSHAGHSKTMDPVLGEFKETVSRLDRNKLQIPYLSNVTGQWITAEEAANPDYYAAHMRQTVRFADGISELLKKSNTAFIQVGPGRGLTLFVDQHPGKHPDQLVIHLLRHPREGISDNQYLLNRIGQLWLSGVKIDWSAFYAEEKHYRMPLPTYPFDRQRYWKYLDNFLKGRSFGTLRKSKKIAHWFYALSWTRCIKPVETGDYNMSKSCWLFFMDACGVGQNLQERLEQKGADVITVRPGSTFSKVNDHEFIINPVEVKDYHLLFNHLQQLGKVPHKIVHLWSVTPLKHVINPDGDDVDKAQQQGFFSMLNLAKAIGEKDISDELQILALSNNMQDVTGEEELCPEKSTMMALVMVISQEFSNVTCRSIDITLPEPGSLQEQRLLDQLLQEFLAKSFDPMIAYRGNYRWEPSFSQILLEKNLETQAPLREKGVYLITGGLGGIGLTLARHFARAVKARLILTGRTAVPPRQEWDQWRSTHDPRDPISYKIGKVLELEQLGAEVLVLQADAGNLEQMQGVMKTIDKTFGEINGVVHTAGVLDNRTLQAIKSITMENCNRQFRPKVYGLLILEHLLQDRDLDFCSLTSSISSILGGLGYAAYSAGNIFMDAFVRKHNRYNQVRWTSVNWDGWDYREQEVMNTTVGSTLAKLSMTAEEGVKAFLRIIAWPEGGQVINSTGNLQIRVNQWVKRESPEEAEESKTEDSSPLAARPAVSSQYAPPATEMEQQLAQLWKSFFGIQEVGRNDNFFELGGDSLKAMIVASKIHKQMKIKVSVTNIFTSPTIKELADYIADNVRKSKFTPIEAVEKKEYYFLSSAQKRLYILQQMEKNNISYNEILTVVLEGDLDRERLEHTAAKLIKRHEVFRTSFEMVDGKPVQRVHEYKDVDFAIEYFDFSEPGTLAPDMPVLQHSKTGHTGYIESTKFIRPFDLSLPPLLRMGLIKFAPAQHILIADMHHITADGTSQGTFAEEFMALYTGGILPGIPVQYKDFSGWQNRQKQEENQLLKTQEAYWLSEFQGELPVLALPTDYERPQEQSYEGRRLGFIMGRKESTALKELAEKQGVSLFMLLLSIYCILLSRLSGQEDIIVGTPTAGRGHPDVANIMGMFINTLALRNFPRVEREFKEFVEEVKQRTLDVFENQDYPFEDLVEKVEVRRDASRNPLFDVMLVLHNYIVESADIKEIQASSLNLKPCEFENQTSKFDLALHGKESENGTISFTVEYCSKLFSEEFIKRFKGWFENIVNSVTENPDRKILEIDILSVEERCVLLEEFNDTRVEFLRDKTIHELFQEQVEKVPDAIAVIAPLREMSPGGHFNTWPNEPLQITYRQLNRESHQLAHLLRDRGIQTDTPVGIQLERTIEMMVGIFGILKAGGAYMPINPDYPEERVNYLLADSGARIILSRQEISDASFQTSSLPSSHLPLSPMVNASATSSAYVIYTSGSTGKPKGVMVQHRAVINRLNWMQKNYPLTGNDLILQKTPFTFDVSVWELFWWSFQGAKVCLLLPGGEKDPSMMVDAIEREKVNVMHFVPSLLNMFLEYVEKEKNVRRLKSLKRVFASGEELKPQQVRQFGRLLNRENSTRLINLYGPTEATVDVSYFNCDGSEKIENVPIGKPIDNIQLLVLDRNLRLMPGGTVGELCITGMGLARGYLNRPELTAEKFRSADQCPMTNDRTNMLSPNDRFYRTGDLARWLPDGNIEFLGRMDHQVKVRGFRIELGEIENQLLTHKDISSTVVTATEDEAGTGTKFLSAYIVSENNKKFVVSELREYLAGTLPPYMIPEYFIQIDKIPLSPNGKIDRKALPEATGYRPNLDEDYISPTTEMEKMIAGIWKEVLKMDKIGINDRFFDIGGNSLNVIQVNNKLKDVFEEELPTLVMFRYSTIRSFVEFLSNYGEESGIDRKKRAETLEIGKSKRQQRLQTRKQKKFERRTLINNDTGS